jgi:uncharacterized membrane protein YiaA
MRLVIAFLLGVLVESLGLFEALVNLVAGVFIALLFMALVGRILS